MTCGYFTILYGLKYGWDQSYHWLMATLWSLALSIFVLQPLKIALVALIFARFLEVRKDANIEIIQVEIWNQHQYFIDIWTPRVPCVCIERHVPGAEASAVHAPSAFATPGTA